MPSAGFRYVYWPDSAAPEYLGGLRRWPSGMVDVVIIRDADIAAAYRVRCGRHGNPFLPGVLFWSVEGAAWFVTRSAVELLSPDAPNAPNRAHPMPPTIAALAEPFAAERYSMRIPPRHQPPTTGVA